MEVDERSTGVRGWLLIVGVMVGTLVVGAALLWIVLGPADGETASDGTSSTAASTTSTASTTTTTTAPTTTTLVTPDDFRRIFVELMDRRAEVFTTNPDPALVDTYAARFAGLYEADRGDLADLQSQGARLSGPPAEVLGVRFESYRESASSISLSAAIELPATQVLGPGGVVVAETAAAGRHFIGVTIDRIEGEWLIVTFSNLTDDLGPQALDLVVAEGVPEP